MAKPMCRKPIKMSPAPCENALHSVGEGPSITLCTSLPSRSGNRKKPPVLSTAESLGLAGAALEARVRRASVHIPDTVFTRIAERLRADALANQMIYEHEGKIEPIRIMLRPLLAMRDQLNYVHHVCLQVTEAVKRFPALYLDDPRIKPILAISPEEERWLRAAWTKDHQRFNPVYGRLDAVCDFAAAA